MSKKQKMNWGDIIGVSFFILVVGFALVMAGRWYQQATCVKFLNDGRKIVMVSTYDTYLIEKEVYVEKLPNGFYKRR